MDLRAAYAAHVAHLTAGTERALAATGYDAVVIASGQAALKNRFDDQHWPLSPTPTLSHWVPLAEPDLLLAVVPGAKPRLCRTIVEDYWEAPPVPEADHFWPCFDVAERKSGDAVPWPRGRVAVISRDDDRDLAGELNPPALVAALDALRTTKTAYEIECLAEATRRAVRGHRRAEALFRAGDARGPSELELHLAYLAASGQDDSATPYKNIVALGEHAAVLHFIDYHASAPGRADTSLLVDAGARALGYGSDITRTYVRGDSAGARRFADLIAGMDALQQRVCGEVRPGMPYEDLHERAHVLIAEAAVAVGILRGSPTELVERGVTRTFLPHGLGHSLGVVTHDVGMKPRPPRPHNPFLRTTADIAVGQVFTIEPGFYFIGSLLAKLRASPEAALVDWDVVAELTPFGGIRIEDNVVVEAGGVRNLTREAFAAA